MSGFIKWLEDMNRKESRVRAVLRRSLSFPPGEHPPAFPYVEPFLKREADDWRRQMYYLVAGLWAMHWREGRVGAIRTIGVACAVHQLESKSKSTEQRFIALLDADWDQLPYRLRQMLALLKDQAINFDALLSDLIFWNSVGRVIQQRWARDFYWKLEPGLHNETTTEEVSQ